MNAYDINTEINTLGDYEEYTFNDYTVFRDSGYLVLTMHGLTLNLTEIIAISSNCLELWHCDNFIGDIEL